MKIRLLHRYKGSIIDEDVLQEGEHTLDDSIAQYLIDNGHAVVIEEQKPITVAAPTRRRRKNNQS